MALTAGTRLGPYEILAQIGAGGMGEVYRALDPRMGREFAGGKQQRFAATEFSEDQGQFSPDSRWVAYTSDESGRNEVYVRPFSQGEENVVSTAGRSSPRWRGDGKELCYLVPDGKLMAVEVTATAAGRSFAMPFGPSTQPAFALVLNWQAGLK